MFSYLQVFIVVIDKLFQMNFLCKNINIYFLNFHLVDQLLNIV
jgi:hypothetical protein